jgi:hypothetical protein
MTVSHRLLSLAGVLVFVSAAIHLSLGIAGLAEAAVGGTSTFLPALYLLGGLAALALSARSSPTGSRRRPPTRPERD